MTTTIDDLSQVQRLALQHAAIGRGLEPGAPYGRYWMVERDDVDERTIYFAATTLRALARKGFLVEVGGTYYSTSSRNVR